MTGVDTVTSAGPRATFSARTAVAGGVLASIAFAVLTLTRVLVGWPHRLWVAFVIAAVVAAVGALASLVPRVARHGDRLVVEASASGGSLALVIAVFLVAVVGLGRVPEEGERSLVILAMVGAALGALVFAPVREQLARRVRPMITPSDAQGDDVLATFSRRIARDIPIEEALLQSAEALRRSMSLTAVEIWAGASGRLVCSTSVPERARTPLVIDEAAVAVAVRAGVAGPAWLRVWMPELLDGRVSSVRVVPLGFGGELLGLIVVEREGGAQDFRSDEEDVLAELARRMSLALHNTQLDHALQGTLDEVLRQSRELEASRRRLVSTSDEERRRIERDLHDGAQQHLVALSVGLNLASGMLDDDPKAASEMLGELQSTVRDTIEELRSLAHGIYPPLLRDGVEPALRAAAGRSPLDVVVDATVDRHSPEVEAAVYFCCLEALQNAAKHAPGASVAIKAWIEEGGLIFEVTDDGPGFDVVSVTHHAGYTNMADRLGAIGGRVEWLSIPGAGTTVAGAIPLG